MSHSTLGIYIMRVRDLIASLALVTAPGVMAADPVTIVTGDQLHMDVLRPGKLSYVVYMHSGKDDGFQDIGINSTEVKKQRLGGKDVWVIDQHWINETDGVNHRAHTVHAARDLATLSQESTWVREGKTTTTRIDVAKGSGVIDGALADERRKPMEQGFAAMKDGWWMNWHSDLSLLPLLPYENGGTLRVRLYDVGMPAPKDVDYRVVGSRELVGGDGQRHDCWLVETDSGGGNPANMQRFWIDKLRRVVLKEEDTFNGRYRSKYLLAVPTTTEFQPSPVAGPKSG